MNFEVIEKKRIARGLTVSKLCREAGIDRGTYYKIRSNPDSAKYSTVSKLVTVVGLNAIERAKVLK